MAAALGPGGGVWRPVSPAFLALSLAFFFLPFVDVRCSSDGKSIVTETGLEAAYGGYTPSPETAAAARAQAAQGPPTKDALSPSLLMCLYPPPLLIGVAFGVFAPMGGARRLVVGCSAACALCLLVMQTAVGFPVEAGMRRGVAQSFAEEAARVRGEPPPPAADAAAAGFVAVYTPWLWLSFAGDGAALFAVALEWGAWRRWPTPAVPRRRDRTLGAAVGLTLLLAVLAGGAWAALSWKGARAPGAALKPRFAQPPPPDEQRATWRKTAAQYRGGYVVAVRSPGLDTWLMYGEEDGQWAVDSRLPRSILRNRGTAVVNEPFKLTLKDAKDMAKWGAGGRSAAAAAVLDVWSKDAPFVVCWYYDDGSGAREFKDAPTPELGRRMDDFLQATSRPTPRGTDRGAPPSSCTAGWLTPPGGPLGNSGISAASPTGLAPNAGPKPPIW